MLSINTDYRRSEGDPEPALRRIAEAGFRTVHWCHHWGSDYLYAGAEMAQIARWLRQYGLQANDLHASEGQEKYWLAGETVRRLAGRELIQNRITLAARLGAGVVVLHLQGEPPFAKEAYWGRVHQALDGLLPFAQVHGVRLALENLFFPDNSSALERVLAEYSPAEVGLCYDSGHGNITGNSLAFLERVKGRLLALHLNDNQGQDDLHQPLFMATVDWERLAELLAASSYRGPLNMELMINHSGTEDEAQFLQRAWQTGSQFAAWVAESREAQA